MVNICNGEWIADLGSMTCKNINNGIIVEFKPCGKTYEGKIKDMDMDLFAEWAKLPDGERLVQKAVMDAEEVFLRAVIETEIENNGSFPFPLIN